MSYLDERRYFERSQAACKLSVRKIGEQQFAAAHCVNLSGSGILFESGQAFELGRGLEMRIRPDSPFDPALTVFVEIVRCSPLANNRFRLAGAIKGIKSD